MRFSILAAVFAGAIAVGAWLWYSKDGLTNHGRKPEKVAYIGVYGPLWEPNFEQKFKVKLDLPMEEDGFLALIEQLRLKYLAYGPVSLNLKNTHPGFIYPLVPKHRSNYDMSTISHSYTIYSGPNESNSRNENYLALVRNDRKVVYVENMFSYDPPLRNSGSHLTVAAQR